MSNSQIQFTAVATNYYPAILREYVSGWMIEYYVENPLTKKRVRKTIKVNSIRSRYKRVGDARKHVNGMVVNINNKLATGWNPLLEGEDARLYTPMKIALDAFIIEKTKELRLNSMRSYNSFVQIFNGWLISKNIEIYSSMFTRQYAQRFMDYVYTDRQVKQVAYNNYLKMAKAIFNWMQEKFYCKENTFANIKPKKKPAKTRILIPADSRLKITEYLKQQNPGFLLVCKLLFSSLIRPKEILSIRIEDINLKNKTIRITSDNAKNHKERNCALTQDIINHLLDMKLNEYPKRFYLFGSNLTPSITPAGDARLRKDWDKLRIKLDLPVEMQLYSLRDSGITEMIKAGIDDLSVMQHADHHSLEMTTIYASHTDPNLVNIIYDRAPKF